MAEDNITPAVNLQQEGMPNEMSAAEFQRRLYAWFEDRGLLSELRAHLRKQMIGALKDTAIGRTVSGQQKQVSPKLQALNLLIAEFLLQQEYHYSLSVFSTEVPLISVLPEFPGLTTNYAANKNEDGKKWQFSEKDMWDILETLGIQPDTDEGKNIFTVYYNGINKEPLLTCIVRMLHNVQSKSRTNLIDAKDNENKKPQSSSVLESDNCEQWVRNINEILSANSINLQCREEIVKILKGILEVEKQRLKDESREEFLKLQITLQLQMARKEEEQRKRFTQIQRSLDVEKGRIDCEKSSRQFKNKEFEHRVQRHQNLMRERYQVLQERERALQEREERVGHREEFLNGQQQSLERGYDTLYREQQTVTDLQEKLQRELTEKQETAKNDADFLKDLQEECKNMRKQITHTQEAVLNATGKTISENDPPISVDFDIQNAEQAAVKGLIRQLQIENSGLRTLNSEHQFRIDELSQRAIALMRELESSQAAVAAITAVHPSFRGGVISAPPLAAPGPQARNGLNTNSGAGEQGFRPSLSTSPSEFRNLPRDVRRCVPPRRLTVHSSSSSDDRSPTNDVLQEARERLRRLEQESEEVDRHYRQFRSRQAQADHFFYQKNQGRSRSYGPYMGNKGCVSSSQSQQGTRPLDMDFNLGATTRMVVNVERLHEPSQSNLDEASASVNAPRNYFPEYAMSNRRETSNAGNNEPSSSTTFAMKQQKNSNMDMAQLVEWHFNQAISCMANNHGNEINLALKDQQEEAEKVERDLKKKEENRQLDNQSVASSGILGDMLAAGTSGVSLSDVETSDEKSESQPENAAE